MFNNLDDEMEICYPIAYLSTKDIEIPTKLVALTHPSIMIHHAFSLMCPFKSCNLFIHENRTHPTVPFQHCLVVNILTSILNLMTCLFAKCNGQGGALLCASSYLFVQIWQLGGQLG